MAENFVKPLKKSLNKVEKQLVTLHSSTVHFILSVFLRKTGAKAFFKLTECFLFWCNFFKIIAGIFLVINWKH